MGQTERENLLQAKTLGCFEVALGGVFVVRRDDRSSKLSQLFAFLLLNRGRMVPQGEIISALLLDGENAQNVLKNLVYRLRKQLAAVGMPAECIRFSGGAYGFADAGACVCDFDRFSALSKCIFDEHTDAGARIAAFREVCALYDGDFLMSICSDPWALSAALKYQKLFEDCALCAAHLASSRECSANILDELRKAANLYPYNENVNAAYIRALYETKNIGEALRHYDKLAALLLDDFGIEPSEEVRQIYRTALAGDNVSVESVGVLRDEIIEDDSFNGAYFCAREIFRDIYRLSVRKAVRSGQSVFLMMCTVRESDGQRPANGERLHEVSDALSRAICVSCRSGDVYTRISPAQYVLMLTEITKESCAIVAQRLRKVFYGISGMKHTQLICDYISGLDIERLLK